MTTCSIVPPPTPPPSTHTLKIDQFSSTVIKPHSHCAGVATVHPDAGQPVYRDAPGHIS